MTTEQGVIFKSSGKQLIAIEHLPNNQSMNKGIIIVVGGPQTRVGSHRLFVHLARALANKGITVFRFDYTGAGDSEGSVTSFTDIQADIHAAIEVFQERHSHIEALALWGLCDAASAILLYLNEYPQPTKLQQLFLINPWVRQTQTQAKTYLQSYYVRRFFSKDFWMKLLSGKVEAKKSFQDIQLFHQQSKAGNSQPYANNFIDEMLNGLNNYTGQSSFVLSGQDLTANEFALMIRNTKTWRRIMAYSSVDSMSIPDADHTFSQQKVKEQLINLTCDTLMKVKS